MHSCLSFGSSTFTADNSKEAVAETLPRASRVECGQVRSFLRLAVFGGEGGGGISGVLVAFTLLCRSGALRLSGDTDSDSSQAF
mmetsp:Transcript_7651/g.21328  ORF Transcript_7651/g.21328 Transcript_7651/m.21328 type:complete len:84 (-) Transcript_7651:182-433(-)